MICFAPTVLHFLEDGWGDLFAAIMLTAPSGDGKRAVGNELTDPSMNMLFCDGHAAFVSCREAYRAIRFK